MRIRPIALVSLLGIVAALAGVMLVSRREDAVRNDALLFLDRFDGLDIHDPLPSRRPLVDALASMPLASDEVDAVRRRCVEAHRTLLDAEEATARARALLDEASAGRRLEDVDLSVQARAEIESSIHASDAALERARHLFERCEDSVRRLRVRFRPQRAREID